MNGMQMNITLERLLEGCADDGFDGGVTITQTLSPLAGHGAPVKPATYAGSRGPQYQRDRRWLEIEGERRPVDAIVIDNVPSQANRCEDRKKGVLRWE
ncbi:MAG: type I-U CRISPR-associated protein Cas7 [Nitriliruptoraceae bacterium]